MSLASKYEMKDKRIKRVITCDLTVEEDRHGAWIVNEIADAAVCVAPEDLQEAIGALVIINNKLNKTKLKLSVAE